jgi:hypothetical protein
MAHHEASTTVDVASNILRWGVPGEPGYHGELDVDFVADVTSLLTVRLDTSHPGDPAVDAELHRALDGIKASLEQAPTL